MTDDRVSQTVKAFLTVESCPPEWEQFDLYRFLEPSPDDSGTDTGTRVVFYIGQSENAFRRVWRHLEDGFKGRSLVGKFVRVNWPGSMNFVVELLNSGNFVPHSLDPCNLDPHSLDSAYRESDDPASRRTAVERFLIETQRPCFNTTWNPQPTAIPPGYRPPNADVPYPRHMRRMMREARVAVELGDRDRSLDMEW